VTILAFAGAFAAAAAFWLVPFKDQGPNLLMTAESLGLAAYTYTVERIRGAHPGIRVLVTSGEASQPGEPPTTDR
jgi:hypothetical protein